MSDKNKLQIISNACCGVLMLIAILVFLLVGIFVPDSWHPVWVVLPASGLVCGIISIIVTAIVNCKNLKETTKEISDIKDENK
ncbi:MAG: hypothetical protein E7354_01805 [Clostridiales bacterium]|nr:hypothetical protein [Clostridiales bacterium]